MKLFLIDSDREGTMIHRLLIEDGKYLMPKRVKGTLERQADELFMLLLQERPEKIIFDEFGVGRGLKDYFNGLIRRMGLLIENDGTVIY